MYDTMILVNKLVLHSNLNKSPLRQKREIKMKYSNDLHRKGELNKVEAMEKLAKSIEKKSNGGLGAAFLTEAYLGADCFAIIANDKKYEKQSGYVLYDEELQKAVFVSDDEE